MLGYSIDYKGQQTRNIKLTVPNRSRTTATNAVNSSRINRSLYNWI